MQDQPTVSSDPSTTRGRRREGSFDYGFCWNPRLIDGLMVEQGGRHCEKGLYSSGQLSTVVKRGMANVEVRKR